CLQEIPQSWVGRLHDLFSRYNYGFIYRLYDHESSGYMGVAIIYPKDIYKSNDTQISTVGQFIPYNKIDRIEPHPLILFLIWLWNLLPLFIKNCELNKKIVKYYRVPFDEWIASHNKKNTVIMTKLTTKENKTFVIATYHMPCAFRFQKVMTIH